MRIGISVSAHLGLGKVHKPCSLGLTERATSFLGGLLTQQAQCEEHLPSSVVDLSPMTLGEGWLHRDCPLRQTGTIFRSPAEPAY